LFQFEIQDGAYLNAGDLVGMVGSLERMRVRAFVDEPELGRVRMGAEVRIRWDARPADLWNGKVARIPSQVVARGSRSVAEVLCEVEATPQKLIPNINLDVEILTGQGEKAQVLPRSCVIPEGKGYFVWVVRNGAASKQVVQTGRSSSSVIEVTGGLTADDKVILPGESPILEGMKVRIQG
jgi:RND family efflux transporter MFP subunit